MTIEEGLDGEDEEWRGTVKSIGTAGKCKGNPNPNPNPNPNLYP